MRYFKIMEDGATICCIETDIEITTANVESVLTTLNYEFQSVEKIIEVSESEAYEWYEVVHF